MTRDVWYWLFIFAALLLGWVVGRSRDRFKELHETISQLGLERDAQARTIQWQRKVIAELEKKTGEKTWLDLTKEIREFNKSRGLE